MVSEADEAAGLSPGNEENEAGRCFSSEKPCLPLSTDGIITDCNTNENSFLRGIVLR